MSEQSVEPNSNSKKPVKRFAALRANLGAIATSLDHEDWLYVAAIGCVSSGAALYSAGAGLICVGVLLLGWPLMARLCSQGKGPGQ